jgi:uncharacterized phage protein gp47/JayE
MAFVARTYEQILVDMIAHVRANTTLTDFTIGSIIRTILEAAALEDDEQYYQMVQLLDAFRISSAVGTDLDERAADLNLTRYEAKESYGKVVFRNDGLSNSELSYNYASGVTSIVIDDSTEFPTTYPYTIRIGENTSNVEDATVSNNDIDTGTLTIGALSNSHSAAERVTQVSGSDITVVAGTTIQVPAKGNSVAQLFQTIEEGVIVAGNYESGLVDVVALATGSSGNVAAGQITQFVSSPPATGVTVNNSSSTTGGREEETDDTFRERLLARYDLLSRGTKYAVEQGVLGTEYTLTGQQVLTAKLVENFLTNDHRLYIDDGTGLVPDEVRMASSTVDGTQTPTSSLDIVDVSTFPSFGWVLISANTPADAELREYTSKNDATNELILDSATSNTHTDGAEVLLVDVLDEAETDQNYFQLSNYPIKENDFEIYHNDTGLYVKQTSLTDYFLNRSNGESQFSGSGLSGGTQVLGHYTYYTGLMQLAQKVITGDPNDPISYPGVVAGGVIINVDTPTLRQITVIISISVENGYDEDDVRNEVNRVLTNYIDSLNIGDNVIVAEIIERAMGVEGVINSNVSEPTTDIIALENELPVSYDSNSNNLVTVL